MAFDYPCPGGYKAPAMTDKQIQCYANGSVLVLGAGVIGVTSAYYLARAGHDVTVLDRGPGAGRETSFANGGQLSSSHASPWAGPSAPAQALKWLGRTDAPLLFKLRADPALWSWSLRFLANCPPRRFRTNTERALRMALYSRQALKELRAETNIVYDQLCRGILHFFRDGKSFAKAGRQADFMAALGCPQRILDRDECLALEPALAGTHETIAGGIYSPEDESGDAYLFTTALAARCRDMGVRFRFGTTIKQFRSENGRITGVKTDKGDLKGENYVLALGSFSPLLARPLGLNLPIYPAKGYSVTLPMENPGKGPQVSLTDDALKLVYSRLGGRLRIAGTAEFTGYDVSLDPSRMKPILNAALKLFPGCADPSQAAYWTGLRPLTPDSVPIIGATPYANLYLNTGHGTLGWTMACGSGRVLADLIANKRPGIDLNGLGLERF